MITRVGIKKEDSELFDAIEEALTLAGENLMVYKTGTIIYMTGDVDKEDVLAVINARERYPHIYKRAVRYSEFLIQEEEAKTKPKKPFLHIVGQAMVIIGLASWLILPHGSILFAKEHNHIRGYEVMTGKLMEIHPVEMVEKGEYVSGYDSKSKLRVTVYIP